MRINNIYYNIITTIFRTRQKPPGFILREACFFIYIFILFLLFFNIYIFPTRSKFKPETSSNQKKRKRVPDIERSKLQRDTRFRFTISRTDSRRYYDAEITPPGASRTGFPFPIRETPVIFAWGLYGKFNSRFCLLLRDLSQFGKIQAHRSHPVYRRLQSARR